MEPRQADGDLGTGDMGFRKEALPLPLNDNNVIPCEMHLSRTVTAHKADTPPARGYALDFATLNQVGKSSDEIKSTPVPNKSGIITSPILTGGLTHA
jgi:hypothetical protein